MDEEGFRIFLVDSTRSLSSINFRIQIVKQFEYILQTFMNVESIEKATVKDLDSFGNWLRKERVVKKFFNAYCRYVSQYFLFIEKIDLAKIAQKGFESKEMKED